MTELKVIAQARGILFSVDQDSDVQVAKAGRRSIRRGSLSMTSSLSPPHTGWTPEKHALLVKLWNENKSFPEMIAELGHSYDAIKVQVGLLRKRGVKLNSRKRGLPAAEARKRRLAAAQAWRDRQRAVSELAGWPPFGTPLFTNDPRAEAEPALVTKIIPNPSLNTSGITSTAMLAVR